MSTTTNALNNSASVFQVDNINLNGNTISSTNTNGNINLTPNGSGLVVQSKTSVGNLVSYQNRNLDNTSGSSNSGILVSVGGGSGGDPYIAFQLDAIGGYSYGIDNSDSDILKETNSSTNPSSGSVLRAMTTAGEQTLPLQPAFLATHTVAQDNVTGAGANITVNFTTEIFDQNSDYNGTNTFTSPVTGRYVFYVGVGAYDIAATATEGTLQLVTSNRTYTSNSLAWGVIRDQTNNITGLNASFIADMDAADTATINLRINGMAGNTVDLSADANRTYFGGYLAC